MILVTALYLGAWTLLVGLYRASIGDAAQPLWLSLPPSTAMMLYVLWPLPALYGLLYAHGFSRWIYTEQDQAEFHSLVEAKRSTTSDDGEGS